MQVHPTEAGRRDSIRACFGVGCRHHHRCARYEAVAGSEASAETLGTCVNDGLYPMFIQVKPRD